MADFSGTNTRPYLSIVFCGRNDNYGGDFTLRLQRTIHHYVHQINRVKLDTELVFVNYNPIEKNPSITKLLDWPSSPFLHIRIITADSEVHQSLINEQIRKTYPLFEFLAKNMGIRRAKGQFILSTNADILLSPKLFDFLAQKQLSAHTLYRCDRLDFKANDIAAMEEEAIRSRVFMAYLQGGTFRKYLPLSLKNWLHLCRVYNRFRKWVYSKASQWSISQYLPLLNQVSAKELFLFDYPCNASGDFTLMDRDSWQQCRAYPEDAWSAAHPDSLLLMQAAWAGKTVVLLDHPIYHQDHNRRFDFSVKNPDIQKMYTRLLKEVKEMERQKSAYLVNDKDWGLSQAPLAEITI